MTVKKRKRLHGDERAKEILEAALGLARQDGYENLTCASVSRAANCSRPLVTHYLGGRRSLRRAVLEAGIARGDMDLIAQGVLRRDPIARALPVELQQRALLEVAAC